MYPLVYVRVHVCTPSYTSGYMYVPTLIRQGTRMLSVICHRVLNVDRVYPINFSNIGFDPWNLPYIGLAIYYWAIVPALCFVCFRLSAIVSVVVSVMRPCAISVVRYGSYPLSISRKLPMYRSCQCVRSWTVPTDKYHFLRDGTNGQISPPEGCRTIRPAAPKGTLS